MSTQSSYSRSDCFYVLIISLVLHALQEDQPITIMSLRDLVLTRVMGARFTPQLSDAKHGGNTCKQSTRWLVQLPRD